MKTKQTKKNSVSKVDYNWFKNTLQTKGISQRKLAKILQLDPATVFHLIHGNRRLQLSEANKIADIVDTPVEEVLEHFGIHLKPSKMPQGFVKIAGYLDSDLILQTKGLAGKREIQNPFTEKNITVLRAQTVGSEFEGLDGCLFFIRGIHPGQKPTIDPETFGKPALVQIAGDEKLRLRVPRRGYGSGRFNLYAISGKTMEEDVVLEASHPVIWMKW
jgi:transcriptional regulator with XRE-family HTH domain